MSNPNNYVKLINDLKLVTKLKNFKKIEINEDEWFILY